MTTFQRARSDEQRAVRRRAILDTAAAMLSEMPVAQVSLNGLSRRVGLAKSNVLRYFESREAVLLELLDAACRQWLAELGDMLPGAVDPGADLARRCDQVAGAVAATLAGRPVLCDLMSAQAAVLEHNVSAQVAARYKRAAIASIGALAGLVLGQVPELGAADAERLAGATVMVTGAVWTYAHPAAAMLAAYDSHPELASMRLEFAPTLREVLEVLLAGLLARQPR
jgi:AcrR family transcriptional regulator